MTVIPLPGVSTDHLLTALRDEATNLANLRSGPRDAMDRFNAYLTWSNAAVSRLSVMVHNDDVDRLVTTPRYWALQGTDPSSRLLSLAGFVDLEISDRLRAFEAEHDRLSAEVGRWGTRPGRLVVPDTNVFLHHDDYFDEIDWPEAVNARALGVHLIIPLLVIDELDRQKRTERGAKVSQRNSEQVRSRARITLRRLD